MAFEGATALAADAFFAMLDATRARAAPPWSAWRGPALVHPALFVHRVEGLVPGLYVLVRDPAALAPLRRAMRPEWLWEKAGPADLPLYLLLPRDLRREAQAVSCHQEIAADSCFALGMLGRYRLAEQDPWRYRTLHWECGMLGQALDLEAEAAGIRGTGIGCFFDDEYMRCSASGTTSGRRSTTSPLAARGGPAPRRRFPPIRDRLLQGETCTVRWRQITVAVRNPDDKEPL